MVPEINKTKELILIDEEIKDEDFNTVRDRFSSQELQMRSKVNITPSN